MAPRLDKKVLIYHIDDGVDDDGNEIRIKHYYNKDETDKFFASFRALSATESFNDHQLGFDTSAQFDINRRVIQQGDYVEFKRELFGTQTYRIVYLDPYDDKNRSRLRIRCKDITPETFDKVEWGGK